MNLDLTKPLQTRDGRQVRILCVDRAAPKCIVGLLVNDVRQQGEHQRLLTWYRSGAHSPRYQSPLDLVNTPQEVVTYSNVYALLPPQECDSKEEADAIAFPSRIACVRLTKLDGALIKQEVVA